MKIGDGPWGCMAFFAVIGLIAIIILIIAGFIWIFNHVNFV
jgi:heme/copper-type cytochrome/quinol oxidase subunit 4